MRAFLHLSNMFSKIDKLTDTFSLNYWWMSRPILRLVLQSDTAWNKLVYYSYLYSSRLVLLILYKFTLQWYRLQIQSTVFSFKRNYFSLCTVSYPYSARIVSNEANSYHGWLLLPCKSWFTIYENNDSHYLLPATPSWSNVGSLLLNRGQSSQHLWKIWII